jgi:hypothetical protein
MLAGKTFVLLHVAANLRVGGLRRDGYARVVIPDLIWDPWWSARPPLGYRVAATQ